MTSRTLLASAVLLTAVACGGDDGGTPNASPSVTTTSVSPTPSPTPTPTPMTKADYVAAVDKICDRVTTEGEKIPEPKTADDYLAATNTIIALIDAAQAEARALVPPAEDAAALESNFYAVNDAQSAAFKAAMPDLQSAAQADDLAAAEKAFGEAAEAGETTDAQDKYMTDYGLASCVG